MFTSLIALVVTMTFSLPAFTPVHAALGAVGAAGPLDAATKFPFWYQDANGLRLGYCFDPVFCFLGNQLPDPTQPPSVPNNFPAEMFYWDADASMPTNNGGLAFMRLGLEAAFLPGPGVVDGQQVTFGRIRFRLDNLQAGATYTITYPYGVDTFVAQTGGRRGINATTDVGCGAAAAGITCNVTLALNSPILEHYLTWDTFGAAADAPPAGFIGKFAVPHRVIGSPRGTNFFRVEGPDVGGPGVNRIQTDLFQVSGQIAGVVVSASPAAGTYSTAQSVTLTASDPAATIYYTTDGSNPVAPAAGAPPTPPTQLYTGPFALPSATGTATTTTVKFLGVGATGDISAIQTRTYTIDLQPLTVNPGPVPPPAPVAPPPAPVAPPPAPVAQLSPASLNFGSLRRRTTSAPQQVTLTNTGTVVLSIASIAIGGANPGDFAIAARTCGTTLAPAASCTVNVTFRPTARNARSGILAIGDNAAGSPHSVALTGTGV